MKDPILYVGKLEHELTRLIHEYGDYLFMVFAWGCLFFIAWLLFRRRKARHSDPSGGGIQMTVTIVRETPDESRFARN